MKTLFLHIGAHKTGTTYLQTALHRHRAALAAQDVDTLSDLAVWGQGQHNVAFAYLDWALREETLSAEAYRQRFRARLRDSPHASAVLSSEFLELFDDAAIARLCADLPEWRTVLIYVVRSQPQYLESLYRESFKQGLSESFGPWMERRVAAGLGDFHAVTRRWRLGARTQELRIAVYDGLRSVGVDVFECFVRELLQVAPPALEPPVDPIVNRSIDRRLLWLLGQMNQRHGRPESHVAGIGAAYLRKRQALERAYYTSPLRLPGAAPARIVDAATARAIEERFEESNAGLLREFGLAICYAAGAGRLFPERAPNAEVDVLEPDDGERKALLALLEGALAESGAGR